MHDHVGVIGSGKFGMTVAKLLAENVSVRLYTRRSDVLHAVNEDGRYLDVETTDKISASDDLKSICETCEVIMPVIPSGSFRSVMQEMAPHVGPRHIFIHCTKGLDISGLSQKDLERGDFNRKDVYSMSEVIYDETSVLRVGCMSGPNLSGEILAGQPAATVIASEFDEVIKVGQDILGSHSFSVFGSYDLKGAELAGAFKNIIAIASGMLAGLGMGKNMQAALITRGLREMIHFGHALGAENRSFLGTAGIGDLIATATSDSSRNYSFGKLMAQRNDYRQALDELDETVEGLNTLNIVHFLAEKEKVSLPITTMIHRVIFDGYDLQKAIRLLMTYNYAQDVDFL